MQRELRQLLEDKIARQGMRYGQGYNLDMSDLQAGSFVDLNDLEGGRRRRKTKESQAAINRRMAKVRAAKGSAMHRKRRAHKRGGDFVDLNDYYGSAYKNPIDKAMKDAITKRKNKQFDLLEADAYAAKLYKQKELIKDAIANYESKGKRYIDEYEGALGAFASKKAIIKAAAKAGIPLNMLKFSAADFAKAGVSAKKADSMEYSKYD